MVSRLLFFFVIVLLASFNRSGSNDDDAARPNILFIITDDMNVDLNCYGGPIVSPNIDKLAVSGIKFNHAYVQQPVCAASRASFLTGLRPNTTGVDYPYSYYFVEEIMPKYGTMSRFFANHGYEVKQFGKVHHGYEDENPTYHARKKAKYYNDSVQESYINDGIRPPYEKTFNGDDEYVDNRMVDSVIRAFEAHDEEGKPFFYVAGIHKPHLVFAAPEKYWKLYDRNRIDHPVPKTQAKGSPKMAMNRYYLNQYEWEHADPDLPFSDDYARLIRHSYYASSSFVDAQVGHLLNALKENGLAKETIVLFISDHGFLMGEQNYWGKTNLFEKGLQVPLIVSWEGNIEKGLTTNGLVEAVDIFPSLVDLAGLDVPEYLEGTSFKKLTKDPDLSWKKGVLSQQPQNLGQVDGVSLRTDRYRYTEWQNNVTGEVLARELYDYNVDPTESENLADRGEYKASVEELSALLNSGWKNLLPEGMSNMSENPVAPPSYAWGNEGVGRRETWHRRYGGSEEEGWRKATERRLEANQKQQE